MANRVMILLFVLLLAVPAAALQTERVVLVVVDGLRYSEGLGDPTHAHVPRMAGLAAQGAIVEPFRNDGITSTWRAVPAIWCGAWTEIDTFNDPDCGWTENNTTVSPTVFEYFRKQLGKTESECVYVLKDVGCPWKGSHHPDYGPDWWPLYHMSGYSDLDVWHQTLSVFNVYSPELLLVYLADVDHYGHVGDWNAYLNAIESADSIVGMIWDRLQQLPDYAGKTTLLVTNDHGRHDWDFSGHGDGCEGCRAIQFLALGPDTPAGLVSTTPRTIPDIAPTIGSLLGFTTEFASGTSMDELFIETAADPPYAAATALQAWPNPFRERTELRFASPGGAAGVSLEIFDIAGRRVDRLSMGASGVTTWTPSAELANGVYLARIVARDGVSTRALVLLR